MKYIPFEKKVYEAQGEHHTVQVFDRGKRRELRFGNHIVQSTHIAAVPDILQLDYTRVMIGGLALVADPARILHVGLGGGTIPRFIHRHWPDVRQTVVELSPEVIDVAYRFFDLPTSQRLDVIAGDGARFLARGTQQFDAIYLDAYHAEGASPEVQNIDTLLAARERMNTAGWLFCNAWGSQRENLRILTNQLRELFPVLHAISVRQDSNVIFFGSVHARLPAPHALMTRAKALARRIPVDFPGVVSRLKPVTATPERPQQY